MFWKRGGWKWRSKAAHKRTRETCGPERLQHELKDQGVSVGICRIRRIRRKLGIRCKQKRKFKATTDSRHTLPVAENLLHQQFEVTRPNEAWVSDVTYIPTEEGWLYLAGHKDLFTGEIVGYAMGNRITKNLVSQSLFRAVAAKRPGSGLIHHSDRGSQYCAHEYRRLMDQFKMRASMSRKGDCYDNAPMESFWGTLKNELVHHSRYKTREQAIREITEYIEVFYNRQRQQARLGNLSRLSLNGSSMQGRSQHEKYFVSTIDIRGHAVKYYALKHKSIIWHGTPILRNVIYGGSSPNGSHWQELQDCHCNTSEKSKA